MFKKHFIILLSIFAGIFVLEFITSILGHPISEITVNDVLIIPKTPLECMLHAAISAFLVGGIANFFLSVRIIKEALGIAHWHPAIVVMMVFLFPLELLVGAFFVIPNIIIFGLKGRKKTVFLRKNFNILTFFFIGKHNIYTPYSIQFSLTKA
jgi:hypothetical protein